ncbi:alpha/beta hydrolase [Gordonia iterans]|uniref:Alpha/beta hydrolase n=1 Tax=Gordonia iterans TaxID=1004901 RepID=A0A2S0KGT8_9ACTN|nr:alpha/beta fold hydrolase [Gordonia iterans]AVM00876.1 alpha/beta hydrolase [Gordonia iterans]
MALREITFESANGRDRIHGWIYSPASEPKAIVQIVHGLGEHSRRYVHMISTLLDAGFVVAADDHAGHGATAVDSGVWMDTGENGRVAVVEDERTLHDHAVEAFPGLPYFVFGHSWGSMIARGYAATYDADLAGLILCGVAAQIEGIDKTLDRAALAAAVDAGKGTDSGLEYMGALFAGMIDRFPDATVGNEWIALDPGVLADHASDPLNALADPMSMRFVDDFVNLYDAVNEGWAEEIRSDLPVLIVAGDQDPVANYGEGAYHVANALWKSGNRDVRTVVYPGVRHEIHNEPSTREAVEQEMITFVDTHL